MILTSSLNPVTSVLLIGFSMKTIVFTESSESFFDFSIFLNLGSNSWLVITTSTPVSTNPYSTASSPRLV